MPDSPAAAAGTPNGLDTLLRDAAADATGVPADRIAPADPRRTEANRPGDFTTAVALRTAASARVAAPVLAERIAARLRGHPHVVDAAADDRGFVVLTVTDAARLSVVAAAARPGYLAAAPTGHDTDTGGSGDPWALSALHTAPDLAHAFRWARDDARRRIRSGRGSTAPLPPRSGPAADAILVTGAVPDGHGTGWRDPYLDAPPAPDGTGAALLLAAIGSASARFAFCRAATGRPAPGEETGPGLPAVPTVEHPGHWGAHTAANPAFAVRYAHAHAVSSIRWARAAERGPAAGSPPGPGADEADEHATPAALALAGRLFDGPGALAAAARRDEPHTLVRYLETLAAAYHGWRETCGLDLGECPGRTTAAGARGEAVTARTALCAATAGVLRSGLLLLGVSAPTRL